MLQQNDIDKIDRFSKGLSDLEEEQYMYSFFAENEESQGLKEYMLSEWNNYINNTHSENYELDYLLNRIYRLIHFRENRREHTLAHRIFRWYSRAAAILLIPLLFAAGFWLTSKAPVKVLPAEKPVFNTLYAPMGSRISFDLPDGTHGWLNSGSVLEYTFPFSQQRQVTLSGEAWFEVARDESHPFEVAAGNSRIQVLGTRFNVNAYPTEDYIEIALEKGKVVFTSPRIASAITMLPDERLVYHNNIVTRTQGDASKFAAWKEGKLVFRGDPMSEVARRIERWYNVEVEVADKQLNQYVFRGTFQDDSLEEVLKLLSLTSPIGYRIVDREMLDDGTFVKKKVKLYLKKI